MDTRAIAERLCEHCRNGTEDQCLQELYAENAESIEPMAMARESPIYHGREAIKAKHDWWKDNFTVNSFDLEGPFINAGQFTVIYDIDVTNKKTGERWKAREVALYEVEDGKIVRETFFMKPMD